MSWSINIAPNTPAPQAIEAIRADGNLPEEIQNYTIHGIEALQDRTKDDETLVTVTGYGHLCQGDNYEVTSATLEVKPGEVTEA